MTRRGSGVRIPYGPLSSRQQADPATGRDRYLDRPPVGNRDAHEPASPDPI